MMEAGVRGLQFSETAWWNLWMLVCSVAKPELCQHIGIGGKEQMGDCYHLSVLLSPSLCPSVLCSFFIVCWSDFIWKAMCLREVQSAPALHLP